MITSEDVCRYFESRKYQIEEIRQGPPGHWWVSIRGTRMVTVGYLERENEVVVFWSSNQYRQRYRIKEFLEGGKPFESYNYED